jgi:hypothetical protein
MTRSTLDEEREKNTGLSENALMNPFLNFKIEKIELKIDRLG